MALILAGTVYSRQGNLDKWSFHTKLNRKFRMCGNFAKRDQFLRELVDSPTKRECTVFNFTNLRKNTKF